MKLILALFLLGIAVAPLHAERDPYTGKPKPQAQMASERKLAVQQLQNALAKATGAELMCHRLHPSNQQTTTLNTQQWQEVKRILSQAEAVPPPRKFSSVYPKPAYILYLNLQDAKGKCIYSLDLHINHFMPKSKAAALSPNRPHGCGVTEAKWCLPDADYEAFNDLIDQVSAAFDIK